MNMHLCGITVDKLMEYLGPEETHQILHMAKKAQSIEDKWRIRTESFYRKQANYVADLLTKQVVIETEKMDFEDLFVNQAFDVMFEAFDSTKRMPAIPSRLATYPAGPMPRSLKELMILWDKWRKGGKAPNRQKKIADKVKRAYIKKVNQVVSKYEDKIRRGEVISKSEIAQEIMDSSKADVARSKTIVETETTRYWNKVRRATYDESPDVTHYIFAAIRDAATTKWCRTRTGLVYAKGDPILDRETPPIHWNCRSEILPLSPLNPRHKRLIDDMTLRRRNHSPEPLPPGWNKGYH